MLQNCQILIEHISYGNLGEDVEKEGEDGEVNADSLASEAFAQILGHRVHSAGHINGHENVSQKQQNHHRLFLTHKNKSVSTFSTAETNFHCKTQILTFIFEFLNFF